MAVLTKAQATKLVELDDKMIDVLDALKDKKIIDAKEYRTSLLEGYATLVKKLQEKKIITAKQAKESIKTGFDYLLPTLAE